MRNAKSLFLLSLFAVSCAQSVANSAVILGRPTTLDITITQGANTIVTALDVAIPAWDPLDGKNYIKIGELDGGATFLYLSVWMQDPTSNESLISFYIRAASPTDVDLAGSVPLFNLNGSGKINATISGLEFKAGSLMTDLNIAQFPAGQGGEYMYSMYMMQYGGWYYQLPETEPVWVGPKWTHQVPFADFRDGDVANYYFQNDSGTIIDIGWFNMYSPVDAVYSIAQSDFPYGVGTDGSGGAVFEMGLGAYAWANENVPEPATMALLVVGGAFWLRRRQ